MDKNTIWAIVLSTVVIVASYLLLPRVFPGMRPENMVSQQTENAETNDVEELSLENDESTLVAEENKVMETAADEAVIDEETITVETDKIQVVLTNRGGDIISYKLKEHKDTFTNDFVQLSDNVSDLNRTLSLSFGPIGDNKKIVSELFEVEKISDYSYMFKKKLNVMVKKLFLENSMNLCLVNIFLSLM